MAIAQGQELLVKPVLRISSRPGCLPLRSALQMLLEARGPREEPTARKGRRWVHESGHPAPGGMGTRDLILPGSQGARGTQVWLWGG